MTRLLETTGVCPAGFACMVALEHLGEPYTLSIRPEGYFVEAHGTKGPRLVEEETVRMGRDAIADLALRCVRDCSQATKLVVEHLRTRVTTAFLRMMGGEAEARASFHDELHALETMLLVVPRSDDAPLAVALVPVVAWLERGMIDRKTFPVLAERSDAIAKTGAYVRAHERRTNARIEDVLDFWFGAPIANEEDALVRVRRWFQGGEPFDVETRVRFASTIEAGIRGELDGWAQTVRGRLALVLVLDQFTRNAFRGTPKMYAGDAKARALCIDALDRRIDRELGFFERMFLDMPLLHAEDIRCLERAVERARAVEPPARFERFVRARLEQAEKYLGVVTRFGRFPFRNAALGRESTPEEIEFLATFVGPPTAMRAA